jgi:hypothetical protein
MTKPTKTINRIHFTDLEDRRFEDLSMQIVYRFKDWVFLHPDGRSGNDDGVDIRGLEKLDDGNTKNWFIQCKRYKKTSASELKKAVDEAISKNNEPPVVFLVVVGCDVSLKARQTFEKYSKGKGIIEPILWQAATLETKLYSDHPDLLFAFFGISLNKNQKNIETKLKTSLSVKRKLNKLLSTAQRGYCIIIHSIDDSTYPNYEEIPKGKISPWFRLEFNDFYTNGIEFILNIEYIILDTTTNFWKAKWARFEPHNEGLDYIKYKTDSGREDSTYNFKKIIDTNKYDIYNTYRIGRISYGNIVEIDEIGDGAYPGIHLYCRFDNDETPYEEFVNQLIDGVHLEMKNEILFAER